MDKKTVFVEEFTKNSFVPDSMMIRMRMMIEEELLELGQFKLLNIHSEKLAGKIKPYEVEGIKVWKRRDLISENLKPQSDGINQDLLKVLKENQVDYLFQFHINADTVNDDLCILQEIMLRVIDISDQTTKSFDSIRFFSKSKDVFDNGFILRLNRRDRLRIELSSIFPVCGEIYALKKKRKALFLMELSNAKKVRYRDLFTIYETRTYRGKKRYVNLGKCRVLELRENNNALVKLYKNHDYIAEKIQCNIRLKTEKFHVIRDIFFGM
ncbi:hypothetical protein DF185_13650 [Marinifilum breve]|uniref:Uncharacterized protein n=1 Tax=Marinifilum breve TaxID=2184082 RepID=A0A2V3ZX73_9BACT|nr:hypothetical protein [Marinifilum breve]PXY00936.1 hypothetical protein DF185_13650 [Marinifilum breve]